MLLATTIAAAGDRFRVVLVGQVAQAATYLEGHRVGVGGSASSGGYNGGGGSASGSVGGSSSVGGGVGEHGGGGSNVPTGVSQSGWGDREGGSNSHNAPGIKGGGGTTAMPGRGFDTGGGSIASRVASLARSAAMSGFGATGSTNVPMNISTSAGGVPQPSGGYRGVTGPNGEPRYQPAEYGNSYVNAQMYGAYHPDIMSNYGQTRLTDYFSKLAEAVPGEAQVLRNPTGMQNIARVEENMLTGGVKPRTALSRLDTTGIRPGTRQYAMPGPHSMGMQGPNSPYNTMAQGAIRDAITGVGVDPGAYNATNFVAENNDLYHEGRPGGAVYSGTYNGTRYGATPDLYGGVVAGNSGIKSLADGTSYASADPSTETFGPPLYYEISGHTGWQKIGAI